MQLSLAQVQAQIAGINERAPQAQAIGLRWPVPWAGPEHLLIGATVFLVRQCDSPLQVRQALVEAASAAQKLVITTQLEERVLGQDVLARLARRRLFYPDVWSSVQRLFQARFMDPGLRRHRWLADALLENAPLQGYAPVANGILDEATVWREVLCQRLGLASVAPDACELLEWTQRADFVAAYLGASEDFRTGVRERLIHSSGPAGKLIMRCLDSDSNVNVLALGLACAIFEKSEEAALGLVAARLERYFGSLELTLTELRALAEAAVKALRRLLLSMAGKESGYQLIANADEILRSLHAVPWLVQSRYSEAGFAELLRQFGLRILALPPDGPGASRLAEVRELCGVINQHLFAELEPARALRARMAVRLLQWPGAAVSEPATLGQEIDRYRHETSWVDRARREIDRGESVAALAEAYSALALRVTHRREIENKRFAEKLAAWVKEDKDLPSVLGIEQVLEKIVAPLAGTEKVLLLVIDGLSWAVFRELSEDIRQRGWRTVSHTGVIEGETCAVSALPSVTETSRASLFCGRLTTGTSRDEAQGLAAHAFPGQVSGRKGRPVLFHKAALSASGNAELSQEVQKEIANIYRNVVGVVVNAVDDHLAKGEQMLAPWTLQHLPLVGHLLAAARNAGRIVILTSDHGHVIERGTRYRKSLAGERYRPVGEELCEGELAVSGPRVLLPASRALVAPWTELLRYGSKKYGYHGGLTPQECLIPVSVLAPPGFLSHNLQLVKAMTQPDWWRVPEQGRDEIVS